MDRNPINPALNGKYVRFETLVTDSDSARPMGFLVSSGELIRAVDRNCLFRDEINSQMTWFADHLPVPGRFNRTTSKGWRRRTARGISWFKPTAHECLDHVHRLVQLLAENGIPIQFRTTARPGYVVYEDDWQVVAEPFR